MSSFGQSRGGRTRHEGLSACTRMKLLVHALRPLTPTSQMRSRQAVYIVVLHSSPRTPPLFPAALSGMM